VAVQDENENNNTAPTARHKNNFFINLFSGKQTNWGISEEGPVEMVHQRSNENNTGKLFFITSAHIFNLSLGNKMDRRLKT